MSLLRAPAPGRVRLRRTRDRLGGPLGAAAAVGAAAVALRLRDPHQHGSWGLCPFKALTGWDCPLCGGLRAVNDLGHGQLAEAAHSNLLFVVSLPFVLALWALWVRRSWTGSGPRLAPRTVQRLTVVVTLVGVLFAVYRNTPWGSAWHVA